MSPEAKFTPDYYGPIKRVPSDIVESLRDMVQKWGRFSPVDLSSRFLSGDIGLDFEIGISLNTRPESYGNIIVYKILKTDRPIPIHPLDPFPATPFVMWDQTLRIEEARQALGKIDDKFRERGLINRETGERLVLPAAEAIDVTPRNTETFEELLSRIRHPREELGEEEYERRKVLLKEVLVELGYDVNVDDDAALLRFAESLPIQQLGLIHKEIEKKLQGR